MCLAGTSRDDYVNRVVADSMEVPSTCTAIMGFTSRCSTVF